ncbi:MAG: ribosome biogenesis/translation initiation ATPase RLI [Candidatus Lokiarchaeota archaeon]|nr:ribosome biogenesis/translation initiation ATPase RLI [Candidatus Harpocratesius repetitus]
MKKVFLIDYDLCSPQSCGRPCVKQCPINLSNARKKNHIKKAEVPIRFKKSADKMIIISEFCIQCGVCLNVCPRNAIFSIFLLDEPEPESLTHEYSYIPAKIGRDSSQITTVNRGFRLYGLPTLLPGRVTGLCGPNGIGKSTVLNILSGDLKPNFGSINLSEKISENRYWKILLEHIRESEMRTHFKETFENSRKIAYKRQVLRVLFEKYQNKTVGEILKSQKNIDIEFFNQIWEHLDIDAIANRKLAQCSGGELQRFAISSVLIQEAGCYLIDEPCTFLDIKKRIKLAELLRKRAAGFNSSKQYPVLVVEHDLAILDYLSDVIHLFYGKPHQFGVITKVQSTKAGINAYLTGFLKTENIQFRKSQITFRRSVGNRSWDNARIFASYGRISKTFDTFRLDVDPGIIYEGEILGIVGENGTGKSTFAKIMAGQIKPDPHSEFKSVNRYVSYKPQYITRNYDGSVKDFIMEYSKNYDFSDSMKQLLYSPLGVDVLLNTPVKDLSGGQLQRVFISTALAKRAELYILDEPSAYLDIEERLHISSVIRAMTKRMSATTIVIEHDLAIVDALSDRLFLFTGKPGVHGKTIGPLNKREGMNEFLKILDITFRRDEDTGRARINKKDSSIDKRQRANNEYFYAPR